MWNSQIVLCDRRHMIENINHTEGNVLQHLRTMGLPQNSVDFSKSIGFLVCIYSTMQLCLELIVCFLHWVCLKVRGGEWKPNYSTQKHVRERSRLLFKTLVLNLHGSTLKMSYNFSLVPGSNIHINGDNKCHFIPYVLLRIK